MPLKVVCLSDTHRAHWRLPALPPGDVLVHAGDFTSRGTQKEILDFNDWLGKQDYKYKVVVPGNHELDFAKSWRAAKALLSNANFVLNDQGCVIEGKRFWGSPWTPEFGDWAFGYSEREGEVRWSQVPQGLDLLITHGPPYLVHDQTYDHETKRRRHAGCHYLRQEVFGRAKPRFHVFGHIHDSYGRSLVDGVDCANVAQLDDRYQPSAERVPVVLEL